jgi:hypothetical protein
LGQTLNVTTEEEAVAGVHDLRPPPNTPNHQPRISEPPLTWMLMSAAQTCAPSSTRRLTEYVRSAKSKAMIVAKSDAETKGEIAVDHPLTNNLCLSDAGRG